MSIEDETGTGTRERNGDRSQFPFDLLLLETVVRVGFDEVGVGEALVELEVRVGVFLNQFGLAAGFAGPVVGFVANRNVQLVVDVDTSDVERKSRTTNRMHNLQAGACAAGDLRFVEPLHGAFAVLRVVLGDFDQAEAQVADADFGDRIAIVFHRQRAFRIDPNGGQRQTNRAAAGVGDQLAVVRSGNVQSFLALLAFRADEVHVRAERLVANLVNMYSGSSSVPLTRSRLTIVQV